MKKYNESLETGYRINVLEGLAGGAGMGVSYGMAFFGYALGLWFGALLVLHKGYTGADVINIIVAFAISST